VFSSGLSANRSSSGPVRPIRTLADSPPNPHPRRPIAATVIQNHPACGERRRLELARPINPGTVNVAAGSYYCTAFSLSGYDLASAVITASAAVDNELPMFLNGVSQG
jgi:hypothetical protein